MVLILQAGGVRGVGEQKGKLIMIQDKREGE